MSTQVLPRLTPAQYLELERAAERKSEYIGGQMYAMAGATENHDRIAVNLLANLWIQLRGTACEVRSSDHRLLIPAFEIYTYPDVWVTCGPPQYTDEVRDTTTNPRLIVEVLSDATKNYDQGEKFRYYRSIPSFAEYLLVAQDEIRAEHYARQKDNSWIMREFSSPDVEPEVEIELASIGCRLILGSLYERVEFNPQPSQPHV
jgi:Uma2 family endonuclease